MKHLKSFNEELKFESIENIWKNISMVAKRLKTLNLDCKVNWTVSKKINLILKSN